MQVASDGTGFPPPEDHEHEATPMDEEQGGEARQKCNGSASRSAKHHLHTATLSRPRWAYFHLALFTSSTTSSRPLADDSTLDPITVRRYLTAALSRFLGQMGAAVPIDILKIDGRHVWVRVPSHDAAAVHEALSSWVSSSGVVGDGAGLRWIIKGRDDWLVKLAGEKAGQHLFRCTSAAQ
ncbi:hypothetical protein FKW77_000298 [Venturia effusa]|uniref:Ribonucleases P/MRP subunit Pop8-like domain-containing protein n=1 Tax=Venturia effusa TaxID=50376 RepID=A0A517LM02_9PEZI|nr:hypothetical protein FKW77_000298 [Venturia effusa]